MTKYSKERLAQTIVWDTYFGLDIITGKCKPPLNLKTTASATKQNIQQDNKKKAIGAATTDVTQKTNTEQEKPKASKINATTAHIDNAGVKLKDISSLDALYEAISGFTGCPTLNNSNKKTVIYDGQQSAKIMLIGEAPGEEEDLKGIPFCGQSGQLLDKALATIGIQRSTNLYITNSAFWRPPANRKPTEEEIAACRPFVNKQIELIKPSLVILCGATALHAITEMKTPIGEVRQRIIEHPTPGGFEAKCIAIYHPAFLLRNPSAKKLMWLDMLFIKSQLSPEDLMPSTQ